MRKKLLCMLCILFVCVLSVYVTAHIIGSNSVSAIATNNRASEVQKRLKEWGYYNGAITAIIMML